MMHGNDCNPLAVINVVDNAVISLNNLSYIFITNFRHNAAGITAF